MRRQLSQAARQRAASLWTYRAGVELEAAARFSRLATELQATGADPTVWGLAQQASRDESRHHVLCSDLAYSLGSATIPTDAAPPRPVHLRRDVPRERLLAEVVAMSCVTETLSTALLLEMRSQARDSEVRDVVHEVLTDEVDHARLGWAHLAAEASRGPVGWPAPHLPRMLASTVHEELFEGPEPEDAVAEAVAGLGGLRRSSRVAVFMETMGTVVFPGLRRFGIDTTAAETWLAERRAPLA
ncbi:MAG: ferritin-like domain-containing protein [Deltaproteobacteria bacterium]|nr:ferritin-like domain-containing protein [Deltaproteobacteria bacterium]